MKVKNPSTGNFEEVYVKALDSLPVGSEIDFTGSASDIPPGWEQVSYDTGWIEIEQTDLAQGTAVTGYYVPAYRKIGNVVYLKGQIDGVTSRATEIFTLPSGFYNSTARLNFCSTNDAMNVNFVRITNAGVVVLQRSDGDFTQGINVYLDDIRFLVD